MKVNMLYFEKNKIDSSTFEFETNGYVDIMNNLISLKLQLLILSVVKILFP